MHRSHPLSGHTWINTTLYRQTLFHPETKLHLSEICSAILSGVTDYQNSGSCLTPSSYLEKTLYLWVQYLDIGGREAEDSSEGMTG